MPPTLTVEMVSATEAAGSGSFQDSIAGTLVSGSPVS